LLPCRADGGHGRFHLALQFEENDGVKQVPIGGFQCLTGLFVRDIGFGAQLFNLFQCDHGALSSRCMVRLVAGSVGRSDAGLVCDRDQDIARGLETADRKIRNT
jgi:hypothetical protein